MWFFKSFIKDEKNFERKKKRTLVSQCVCVGGGEEGVEQIETQIISIRKERFF